jgi:hypothetical protein
MATRMQQRRGTAAQWISLNDGDGPILAAGEIGFETDTGQFKIGDGITHWDELSYFKNLDDLGGSLDDYILVTSKGAASGVAELDATFNVLTKTGVVFEGATANDFETTLQVTEPTADRAITLPNASGTVVLADGSGNVTVSGDLTVSGTTTIVNSTVLEVQNEVKFEGLTANGFETSLKVVDPTADREITFPDATGTVALLDTTQTLTNKTINLTSNTLATTLAQLNTAVSDADVATIAGSEILTNKTLTSPKINEDVILTATATELNILDGVTATAAQINVLTSLTASTAELNILDGATLSTAELNILDGITATSTEINYLSGVTSAIQTQLSNKQPVVTGVTDTEIGYLDGVTSAIQTQLDAKLASATAASTYQAKVADVSDTEISYLNGVTSPIQTQMDSKLSSATAATTYQPIIVGVSDVEIGYLDGVTSSIQTQINGKQATVANVSDVEIGYLDGVTSGIQAQLNNKQAVVANVSDAEIGYLDGVTSAIQTQLDAKLASATAASTYAPLASPALTGTPTATLAVTGTNTTQIATTSFVQQEIGVLTAGAPAALNTLDELAAALGDDASYAASITTALGNKAPLASPTFTGTVTLPAAGIVFTDGTQAKEGVPSRTPISQKTDSYTLSALTERDSLIEVSKATATTITIPTDATLNFPIGTSIDILQTGAGQVTIAPVSGTVTVNATPGLKLRTTWSSATLLKRAANTWVVFGDLTA